MLNQAVSLGNVISCYVMLDKVRSCYVSFVQVRLDKVS